MRTPCDEFRKRESINIIDKLSNDQIICDAQIGGRESPFRKRHIAAVQSKRDLILYEIQICFSEAWTRANNEGALTLVGVFHLSETFDALTPPRMKISIGQFWNTT